MGEKQKTVKCIKSKRIFKVHPHRIFNHAVIKTTRTIFISHIIPKSFLLRENRQSKYLFLSCISLKTVNLVNFYV